MNYYRFLRESIKDDKNIFYSSAYIAGGVTAGIGGFCLGAVEAHKTSKNISFENKAVEIFKDGTTGATIGVLAWMLLPLTVLTLSAAGISSIVDKYNKK